MADRLVLLGDSVIDNVPYVRPGEPGVAEQVADRAPDWSVDARAVDGATCAEVLHEQLRRDPGAEALIVLSAGGNDALNAVEPLLDPGERTLAASLELLHEVREAFRCDYGNLLDRLVRKQKDGRQGRRVLVFTIYNPRLEGAKGGFSELAGLQLAAEAALSFFNDVIQQEVLARELDVLDLRRLCNCAEDFANPIEPSAIGGAKIADAVVWWANGEASRRRQTANEASPGVGAPESSAA